MWFNGSSASDAALSDVLTALFVSRQVAADAAPAVLTIDRARARTVAEATAVRIELDAHLDALSPR